MTRARQLAATLTEIFEGDPWYAPSVKAALDGITAVAAAAQPITGAHTIWEITAHMDAWNQVCLRRLAAEVCVEPDVNFAEPDEISPNAWRRLREKLAESCRQVIARAGELSDGDLAHVIPGKDYNADFLMEGVGQHWIYHSGQIAILRRA